MYNLKNLKSISANISVLYVEDDNSLRESVAKYLGLIFEEVDLAEDGKKGLNAFNKKDYDIVITDIQMPNMNGLDMVQAIREKVPSQAILITTAFGETQYLMEAISLDVSGYIVKPINFDKINQNLYKVVKAINIGRENQNYKINLEKMIKLRTAQNSLLQEDKIRNYEKTLVSLVDLVEKRDTYTGGHSQRVANYCKLIAEKMGYDEDYCELLYKAGILHDIGKIGTPDAVLLKPGKLDKLECSIMQEHVSVSADLLRQIPMYQELSNIIASHHEHYDGSGYPNGLQKNEIPELARIMIVADAFDAMTTSRIYKGRMSVEDAIKELKACSGSQFDPEVVDKAIDVLKGVTIDINIVQLPSTEREHKRFAYFYKDQITEAYNQQYLDLILTQDKNILKGKNIILILTHNFADYNISFGWEKGNTCLKNIVETIFTCCEDSLVFRIHGVNFVVISDKKIEIGLSKFESILPKKNHGIRFTYKELSTLKNETYSLEKFEKFYSMR